MTDTLGAVARLLVVEDDDTIGGLLDRGLRSHGHEVVWCRSGRAALHEATIADFDLILLDLGLPDLDGFEVCRRVRAAAPGCVLVILTARDEEMDVVVGLEAGADDYLTKPFRYTELLARIRAHLRRGAGAAPTPEAYIVGDLTVDTAARRCSLRGHDVALRSKEFDLLARLAAEPNLAITRETLMADVWDENWHGSTKTLDVHVAALRRKLAAASENVDADIVSVPSIATLRGYGYRLESAPS
ncbi:response regulator transcription factor [Actinopolymorpha alba]|uniref:response regulator transcription factor n=1 Tax=Actinopolymorpha alba TaxID=533267 RepID=UPI00037583D7|nr:response regulator transcription factor [Actinopolymorpha alba]